MSMRESSHQWWRAVHLCMVLIWGVEWKEAEQIVRRQRKIYDTWKGQYKYLYMHDEPVTEAADLCLPEELNHPGNWATDSYNVQKMAKLAYKAARWQ